MREGGRGVQREYMVSLGSGAGIRWWIWKVAQRRSGGGGQTSGSVATRSQKLLPKPAFEACHKCASGRSPLGVTKTKS